MNAGARLALAVVLALVAGTGACAERAKSPAWPELHASDDDGGESLAPRATAQSVETAARDDREDVAAEVSVAPIAAPPTAAAATTVNAPASTAGSDEPVIEEMTIDVNDDD